MASAAGSSNKAKIARRVIEVLDYFDEDHREATVMDIVRRYDRPQSSTSELLSSLVELGLLYKDPYARSYSLAPRAALIGTGGQCQAVRDGRLVRLVDRLAAQTGLSVAVFGMVGLNVQIMSWRPGARCTSAATRGLHSGLLETLDRSAAGCLLLSTVDQPRRDAMVRRLIAEAPEQRRRTFADIAADLTAARDSGMAQGPAGFGSSAETISALLPIEQGGHPLAVGFVFGADSQVEREPLKACLAEPLRQVRDDEQPGASTVKSFPHAA
jgi:DNA-binding IclR family transcriptional regulator